jgi:hypothetical protein
MPNTVPTTPAQGFPVPVAATDDPDVTDDMSKLAKAIEKRVVGVYATAADRDTKTAAAGVEEGMFAFTKDDDRMWYRSATAWVAWPPTITSGTAVPANSAGVNGDVFFKV